jgi:Type IV secretion system pilin
MKMISKLAFVFLAVLSSTAIAGATGASDLDLDWFDTAIATISSTINILIPLLLGIALLYFVWGVVQFVAAAGDEGARSEGKSKMIWGIVGLFVIVSVWGFVNFLGEVIDLDTTTGTAPGFTAPVVP